MKNTRAQACQVPTQLKNNNTPTAQHRATVLHCVQRLTGLHGKIHLPNMAAHTNQCLSNMANSLTNTLERTHRVQKMATHSHRNTCATCQLQQPTCYPSHARHGTLTHQRPNMTTQSTHQLPNMATLTLSQPYFCLSFSLPLSTALLSLPLSLLPLAAVRPLAAAQPRQQTAARRLQTAARRLQTAARPVDAACSHY